MADSKHADLGQLASKAHKGQWSFHRPTSGKYPAFWVHNGMRVHVADNVGEDNAAFIAAANPVAVTDLINDYDTERAQRIAAEREIQALRLENEALRHGVRGDFDLDAWLEWRIIQQVGESEAEHERFEAWYLKDLFPGADDQAKELARGLFARKVDHAGDGFAYARPEVEAFWGIWMARANLSD